MDISALELLISCSKAKPSRISQTRHTTLLWMMWWFLIIFKIEYKPECTTFV